MSVHKDLMHHAELQNRIYREFLALDQRRESYIEEAIELCKQGRPFSTNNINDVTNRINKMHLRIIPSRKNVTVEMVMEYAKSL
ncbi:MAG: YpbS family protein [Bacillus sp. (in: Bacteria)]|nr:YpbS family protein [Bacillus sp. (in: firmicutes)]